MFKKKTRRFLQIISVLLTFAIFTGTFTAAAEAVQNENTNHVWLIMDNLTETPYSDNIFNRYEDKNFETNTAEIFTYNESGEVDYTYSLSGSVGDATASLDLNFWHNTNDLGNAPYDSIVTDGAESFSVETDGTNFMNSVYGFGIGWSLDIPQIEYINSSTAYFHNGEGKAYRIGAVTPENEDEETTYKLCGFPYDYTIEKNIVFENEEDTEGTLQGFIGTDRYGNKDYFNRDGRFIKSTDKNDATLKTVTYDQNRLIASYSENSYTLNFVRTQTTDSIKVSVNMAVGEQSKNIGILTIQNNKLSSALFNTQDESSYTTNDGAIIVMLSDEGRETVSFEYEETKLAILGDSESIEVASTISGYDCLTLSNVTVNTIDRTEYSYAATDAEDTASLQLAELYNSTDVAYDYESTEIYNLTNQKDYKLLGAQSSQRNKVISQIERNSTDIVNPGYDPADPNNTEETETNPVSKTTTETTITDFVYSDNKVTGCYAYIPTTDDSAITTTDAVVYDYTIDESAKTETHQRVDEDIFFIVSQYSFDATKESPSSEWVLDEESGVLKNTIGKTTSGDVVYKYSDESAIYYQVDKNGNPTIEDIENGLKYVYTYNDYQQLVKSEFDNYSINYNETGAISSIQQKSIALLQLAYNDNGDIASEQYGNDYKFVYDYNENGTVKSIYNDSITEANRLYTYEYDVITDESGQTHNRLISVMDCERDVITRNTYASNSTDLTGVSLYSVENEIETLINSYSIVGANHSTSFNGVTLNTEYLSESITETDENNNSIEVGTEHTSSITIGDTQYSVTTKTDLNGNVTEEIIDLPVSDTSKTHSYIYDEDNKITSEIYNASEARTYTYNEDENVSNIASGSNETSFEYDESHQLIRYNDEIGNQTIVYEYDNRGNIEVKKVYPYTVAENISALSPSYVDSYGYTNTNWPDQLKTFNGQTINYDNAGNIISYNGYSYTWDKGRQLKSIANGSNAYSYFYDYNGIRTSKTINGTTTNYITNNGRILAEYTDTEYIVYWYDYKDSPIGFIYGTYGELEDVSSIYYYKKNVQGDIIAIYNSLGEVVGEYCYDAWGNHLSITQNGMEAAINSVVYKNHLRYRGYYYDDETGYYYLQSRYYNPSWHRFINADEFSQSTETMCKLECNLFAYCSNNPVCDSDPTGNLSQSYFNKFVKMNKPLKKYLQKKMNIYVLYSNSFAYAVEEDRVKEYKHIKAEILKLFKNANVSKVLVTRNNFKSKWKNLKKPDLIFINCHGNDNSLMVLPPNPNYDEASSDFSWNQMYELKYHQSVDFLFLLYCFSMNRLPRNQNEATGDVFSRKISGLTIGSTDKVTYNRYTMLYDLTTSWYVLQEGRRKLRSIVDKKVSIEFLISTVMYSAYLRKLIDFN